jgi:hypothetical protein
MTAAERAAASEGIALGCAILPLVYAIVRVVVARVDPEPDPVAVVWSEHSPSLTRLMLTLYVTAAIVVGAIALVRARPAAFDRVLTVAAMSSATAILALCFFAP